MPILAVAGKARSGKDTFSNVLVKNQGFIRLAFADSLRQLCSKVFGISVETFESDDLKDKKFDRPLVLDFHHIDKIREILITEYGYEVDYETRELLEEFEGEEFVSPRHILRIIGTPMLRGVLDDQIWLKQVAYKIKESGGKVVISDCRFENERDFLRSIGAILVLVKRNDNGDSREHEFNLGQDYEYDVVFTNDATLQEYKSNVEMWYTLRRAELEYTHTIDYTRLEEIYHE